MNYDLDEANEAALMMVDMLPLYALLDMQKKMIATDAKYAAMGIGVPPLSAKLKAKMESRIAKLSKVQQ